MFRTVTRLLLAAMVCWPAHAFAQQAQPLPQPGVPVPNQGNPAQPTPGQPAPTVPGQPAPNAPGQPNQPGGIRPPGGNNNTVVDGPVEAPPPTDQLLRTGMAMPNASIIKVILPIYQQLTGKRVVLDTNIADNNVRIVVAGPISKEDLVDFIERSLLTNGFAFVPTNKENTVKLINALAGQPLRAQGGTVFVDPVSLPFTDAVVTYVMKLDYIKPEEAARIFPQIIQLNSYGAIAAVDNASAIIITDDVAIVRQLIELAKLVDVPSAQVATKWFELERADAEKAAEFLAEVLDTGTDDSAARAIRSGGAPAPAAPGGAPAAPGATGGSSPGASEGPSIKIVADTRRNAILAVARPLDMQYIESLITEYDSPSKVKTFLKRPLKFVVASELLVPLQDALERENSELNGGSGAGASVSAGGGSTRTTTNASRGGLSGSSRGSGSNSGFGNGSSGFGGSGFGGGGGASSTSPLGSGEAPPVAESVVIGKTLLVADNARNSIIVSGPPESIRLVEEIIDQIDMRPRQVQLATIIGQMSLDNNREYGLNLLRSLGEVNANENLLGAGSLGADNFPTTTGADGAAGGLLDITDLADPTNFPAISGLNLYGKLNDNINAYLKLLETQNRFRVLQRPLLTTSNYKEALISSGQRIAVPTNSFTSGATVGTTQSTNIEYRDVVLELRVLPLINSENEVTLTISQVNDKVVGSQTIDGNAVPIIGTESIETTVTVTNGQTVVLGGLITERTERTVNGVPVLIQIPLIKHLFGTTTEEKRREELMIFIQPKILDTAEQVIDANVSEVRRVPRGEEIVEFAVPEYPEIKARAEADAAAAAGEPPPKRKGGGLLQKMKLFGE